MAPARTSSRSTGWRRDGPSAFDTALHQAYLQRRKPGQVPAPSSAGGAVSPKRPQRSSSMPQAFRSEGVQESELPFLGPMEDELFMCQSPTEPPPRSHLQQPQPQGPLPSRLRVQQRVQEPEPAVGGLRGTEFVFDLPAGQFMQPRPSSTKGAFPSGRGAPSPSRRRCTVVKRSLTPTGAGPATPRTASSAKTGAVGASTPRSGGAATPRSSLAALGGAPPQGAPRTATPRGATPRGAPPRSTTPRRVAGPPVAMAPSPAPQAELLPSPGRAPQLAPGRVTPPDEVQRPVRPSWEDTSMFLAMAPGASGLGALQPDGREEVLQQWQRSGVQAHAPPSPINSMRQRRSASTGACTASRGDPRLRRASTDAEAFRTSVTVKMQRPKSGEHPPPRLDWSSLSAKARRAVQQWYHGQIGGRHCSMVLEHDAAIALFISPLDHDVVAEADLRGGVVLNALSGLSAEVRGGWDGDWLHAEVFGKSPAQVLEEALLAAFNDSVDAAASMGLACSEHPARKQPDAVQGLTSDQVNLALRRRAMQAQSSGMATLLDTASSRRVGPRCSEEFMRSQVWLELARLHIEGSPPDASQQGRGETSRSSFKEPGASRRSTTPSRGSGQGAPAEKPVWDDEHVLTTLRKQEAELLQESKSMSLDALRVQNRSIEAYLMRLVRQRDHLKHIAKLAEECDSYLVLGLDGPSVTDEEVKKAYRELARREHPDKAGVDNKERFQEIQQAYSAVLRRRKSSRGPECRIASAAEAERKGASAKADAALDGEPAQHTMRAARLACEAKDAAEALTAIAHVCFLLRERSAEARGLPKRASLRELHSLTRCSAAQLRQGAESLRAIHACAQGIAACSESALEDYGEWADTAMAGAGLKDRADIMSSVGQSCTTAAEHLEKMRDQDSTTLSKMERASCEVDVASGARMLAESLVRTAMVTRCAADEAIVAATTALELGCSLAVLDRQHRVEQAEQEAEKAQRQDSPRRAHAAGDGSTTGGPAGDGSGGDAGSAEDRVEKAGDADKPAGGESTEAKSESSDSDRTPRGSSKDDAKKHQASLRARHLQCMANLNDEVLTLQKKLVELIGKSGDRPLLLPSVEAAQKGGVFDLVAELLNASLADAAKLAAETAMPSRQVLERSFSFALALEHAQLVALPSEVKTQALKLAALLDVELLCEIIDGPFKRRLLGLEKCRPVVLRDRERAQQLAMEFSEGMREPSTAQLRSSRRNSTPGAGSRLSLVEGESGGPASSGPVVAEAWSDAVHCLCSRIVDGLRLPLPPASRRPSTGGAFPP